MPNDYETLYSGGQRRTGGAIQNGTRGSQTMPSRENANTFAAGARKGDSYSSFRDLGTAWGGALAPRTPVAMGPAYPQAGGSQSFPQLGGRNATGFGIGGGMRPFDDRREYRQGPDGSVSDAMPGQIGLGRVNMGFAGSQFQPAFGDTRTYRQNPDGSVSDTLSVPQWRTFNGPPISEPGPGRGFPPLQQFNDPWMNRSRADAPMTQSPDNGQSGFNPGGPTLPPPYTLPGDQPQPSVPFPPAPGGGQAGGGLKPYSGDIGFGPGVTPAFAPPASPGFRTNGFDMGFGPGMTPSFAPRGGTGGATGGGAFGPLGPSQGTGGTIGGGMGGATGGRVAQSMAPQQYVNGLPISTDPNGYGRRITPVEDPESASGRRRMSWQRFRMDDGRVELWETDQNGQPIRKMGMGGDPTGKSVLNWPGQGASTPPAGSQPGSATSTTGGQFSAPNNSTTFDPSVLPASNVGDWLDPVAQDAMDRMTRQLRHEASLTGATNSGGYIPGMTEKLAPVANQFAAQKGQLMYEDQNRKADRLLDKYKFDNTQQLQKWIQENQMELERYGIDTNALLGRYQSDQSLKAAGMGADASRFAARTGADSSRYNAMLDYMQGMAGIGANYGLGQDRLGFDYYNANQNYDLGRGQLGYNYWNSGQQRAYDDMFNQRGYDLGVYGINRDVYGMDQAQQRYLMDLMWRMSPGGQQGGGYFPTPGMFPYGG